ncbi:hypothetical protein PF008_g7624 [Phytophthora fragariae]|uniref:Uncharacterized protein n=1 Tax=Phytophthora fragariae TaxID=53985 RepID=A0A6G0S3N7_9STRA|nr:hypothetical protein PF008_g7624 [Phytophthora fragariae]
MLCPLSLLLCSRCAQNLTARCERAYNSKSLTGFKVYFNQDYSLFCRIQNNSSG